MPVEQNNHTNSESTQIRRIGSGARKGDFILMEGSPTLYWEGEPINVSELWRDLRTGLRNRYGTASLPAGVLQVIKEVFSQEPIA